MSERETLSLPRDPLVQHTLDCIRQGVYIPATPEQVRAWIQPQWEQTISMLSMLQNHSDYIREVYIANRSYVQKTDTKSALAQSLVYIPHAGDPQILKAYDLIPNCSYLLSGYVAERAHTEYGLPFLTVEEKLAKITTPEPGLRIAVHEKSGRGFEESLTPWGVRNFFIDDSHIDSYGVSKAQFQTKIAQVKERTQSKRLKVMDVGCGNGLALSQIQMFCRELGEQIETIGLGDEEALAMYPMDTWVVGPVERMPRALFEQADIIVSNRAFEYFTFTDVGLFNTVLALKPGGWAKLQIGYEDSFLDAGEYLFPDFSFAYKGPGLEERVSRAFAAMNDLHHRGIITLSAPFPNELPPVKYHYYISLEKHASIPKEFFQQLVI